MVDLIAGDARVNIFTQGNQDNVHLSALTGGGYVAVWQSTNQNGSGTGLVAQIYNDSGQRSGLPFFIEEDTVGNQTIGGVSGTADGGFVVTWRGADYREIYARQFDAAGQAVAGEFQVNTEIYSTQSEPTVTGLTGGDYVVTWSSVNDETFTTDIRAQRYDAAGVAQGAEFTVNTTTASTQYESEITALNDGGFVVTWTDVSGADGSSNGVYAQRYNATGVAQGSEFLVNSTTANAQYEPDVVALSGGGFVVVWRDNTNDGSSDGVFAQVYNAAGVAIGGEILINQQTTSAQWEPAVAATADGGFFVTWYSYYTQGGYTYDIVGRHFDATGTALTDDIVVSGSSVGNDTRRPDVIGLANGGIVVGWDYPASDGDGDGRAVYQAVLELNGSNIALPVTPVLEAFDTQASFTESQLQAAPQLLDADGAAAVSGPADFDGGRLTLTRISAVNDQVQFNAAAGLNDDVLGLRDQGTGAGQIGVSGTDVTFGGVVIGTITSDGANGAPFQVTFNANADREAVEAVAENLTYQNPSDDPAESVELAILLEDGDGGASDPVRVSISVTPEDDAPRAVFAADIDVNSFTNSTQQAPAVAALSDGGWVVMWESYGQDNLNANNYGIIGQRYDASGAPVAPEFIVNTQTAGSQQQVDVEAITGGPNAGGFVAVWYNNSDASNLYVHAQIYDAAGQPVGGEITVPTTVYSTQQQPSVATFADGSFAVAWNQSRATTGQDIVVQRFDASGTMVGTEIDVNTVDLSTQHQPEIVALAGGGFAVTWATYDQAGTVTYEISARVFAADGTPVSDEVRVNTAQSGQQSMPDIAALDSGGFVVVWEDQSGLDSSGYGVYGQIFNASGAQVGTQFLVNEITQSTQYQPVVTALQGGGFAVSFYTQASVYGGSANVAMQQYDAAGNRVDGEFLVNQQLPSGQYEPAIATLANGDVIVAMRDDSGRDGSGSGIIMQIVGDPANYAAAQNNPNVSIAQSVVSFDEADVNAAPQILFDGVHVGDADSADFDGGTVSVFRAGAATSDTRFEAPDDETQDNLSIRDQGTAAGEIGISGANVTFGGTVIGTISSDGADGTPLTVQLNNAATHEAVEALLENVTYANPSDDPNGTRDFRVTLTDGDGGSAQPVDVQVQIAPEAEGVVALSPELQVNSYEESAQYQPDVGALAAGGYVAVWSSYHQDAGTFDYGIFAQRFDATGQPVGDEYQVNSVTAGSQNTPVVTGIAAADGGGYVVVWADSSNNSGYIKAQVHNDDGSVRTPEFMVETEVYSTQSLPAVEAVPGGFLVTWSSANNESLSTDIRGQFYDGNGAVQGGEFTVNTTVTVGTQNNSDLAVDQAGNVVVVWDDQSAQDGSSYGVYGQRIDSSGTLVGAEFLVNTNTTGGQYNAQVDYLSDGRFVVGWYDDSGIDGSGGSVMAQIYAANGTPIGGEFLVNEQFSSTQQIRDIQGLADGGFAIAYDDASGADGSGWGVFLQQFNADGSRRDGAVQINQENSSTQDQVRIAEITDGGDTGIAAVWVSGTSLTAGDGSGQGIFTRVLGEQGTLQPANVLPEVENLASRVNFDVATIGTAQIIDNALELSDPDSADFAGGSVELRYLGHQTSADDQLSVLAGRGITVSGADVSYDGTVIGTIDGTDDGINGNDLVINLNASSNPANVRYLMEQLGFASSNPVAGSERYVSVRVTDGDGAISEGDSIRIDIENSVNIPTISLTEVDDLAATEMQVEAGLRLDPAVDFDYTGADGFDGGLVEIGYRDGINSRVSANFETLSVSDDGVGSNQIGISGSNILFEGTIIGSVDGVLNGQNGANLGINLVAAATSAAVDALIEAFTYFNDSDGPATLVRFDVRVTDSVGATTGDRNFNLSITPEVDGATVALGDEMQVNAYTESTQRFGDVTELADGGFVVTWESYNQDSSNGFDYGVYQQRYTAAGEPVGPEVLVNERTSGPQDQADVAGLTGGGWVTVWEGPGSSGQDVHARIFDANGVGGTEFQLNLQNSSAQYEPSVTALANGNFAVVWSSETSAGAGDGNGRGIIGRVFQADGTPVSGTDIVLNSFTTSTQYDAQVAGLSGGGFVAVWSSNGVDGTNYGVAFQRFDNAGTPQGVETVANTTTAGNQDNASVTELTDGGFVIVWQSPDSSGDGIYLQRYDASGVAVGVETQVNDYDSSTQSQPDVTGTTDGGWVVTWSDSSSFRGSGTDVIAQRYDASGSRVDGNFRVNEEVSSTQDYPSIATLSDGRVVIAWDSESSGTAGDGSNEGVFVRLFGTQAQATSGDPQISGVGDVTLEEAALNAGSTQVFAVGSIAVSDLDSSDFDGGRLMVHVVRDYAAAELFNAPDDLTQDVLNFVGTGISISAGTVGVDGLAIGTLESDGQSGNGLQLLLNSNATAERIETLLNGLSYANPSNDPQSTREVEITLSDGDGGVTQHQTFTISITPETDGFERVGDETQVNSFTLSGQDVSDVAGLSGGGHVVVWRSIGQDNPGENNYGVFGQRFDVDGQPVGPEFQVNTTFPGSQGIPSVVGLSDGSFVVAWQGNGVGDSSGVFGQLYAADGTPVGTEFRLNDVVSGSESDVHLAASPAGGFMAVWYNNSPSEVQGRLFDSAGVALGTEFAVNNGAAASSSGPEVTALSGGGYGVVWYDQTTQDVFLRVLDGTGAFVTADTNLTSSQAGQQIEPNIAGLAGGGMVVTWTDRAGADGNSYGTFAQVFSASGVAQSDAFLMNGNVSGLQDDTQVVGTPDGGFVVVYRDTQSGDGSGQGVIAQQFDANGNRVDGQVIVNTEFSGTQFEPAIDVLANGSVVVSWTSNTSGTAGDGSGNGVFAQILGNPADFNLEGRPELAGLNETVTYLENTLNIGPQLLDANNAVAVSDSDSADFDGGFIRIDNVISTRGYQNQVSAPDNFTQDNLGLRQAQGITISSGDVFVNGTQVGTIVQNGVAGDPLEIALNSNATVAIVELLVENLTYRNTSDDPDAGRVVRVQIGDGDGGVSDPSLVTINITAEVDGAAPVFGERQANTETASEQAQSDVAYLDDGGFVIVWRSYNQDDVSPNYGVFGQRFDANGNAVGTEFQVNTTVTGSQYEAGVTGLDTGGWAVSWRDDSGADGSSSGIFMQRYNADGTPAGGETQVNTYFSSTQYEPEITMLENGDYVVTWTSWNNTAGGGNSYDIWAQVFQSDGTSIGSEFLVNSEISSNQTQPSIAALETGGFAISWTSTTSGSAGDSSGNGVFYQVFANSAASYAAVGGELQANSFVQGAQDFSSITGLTGGGYVVVWESASQDGSGVGVFAQQYDAAGVAIGQEFRVNDQRIGAQNQPDVAALSNGGYVIVFSDNNSTDGSGVGVFAQQFAANGNRVDGALQVNTEFSSTQNDPSVAALDNGGFVVSWTSNTSGTAGDGSGTGVFYQVFSNSAPVVTDVSASTAEDTNLIFASDIFEDGYADAEGQALAEIRIDVLPSTGTLEFNGSPVAPGQVITVAELDAGALVFVPPMDYNGVADFGWTGSDGTSFAATIALTNITVTPVNDAVGLAAIGNQTISEGSNLNIQALFSDPDNDTYAVTVNYGEGNPDVTFNTASHSPSLVNYFEAEGTYTVNLSVDDQNGSVESLSFTVTVENAAPIAGNNSYSTDEDTPLTGNALFANDSDPGNDPFTVSGINGATYTPGDSFVIASGATVTILANGEMTYDPTTSASIQSLASGQTTSDSFTYTITDDGGLSDTATVTMFLSGADDNVNAQDDDLSIDEDSTLNGDVFADNGNGADVDPEGDMLSVVSVNGSTSLVGAPIVVSGGGVLQINSDGTLSFAAANNYDELNVGDTRDINFTYVVEEDGSNLTASAQGTITINGVNDDPTANDDSRSTPLNTAVNLNVLANDFDVDTGDTFSVTNVSDPANGSASIELDGTVTYTPDPGYSGPDSFSYEITDANGGTSSAMVNITVEASNAPDAQNDSLSTNEDTPLMGNLFADNGNGVDSDPEGDAFSITAVNGVGGSNVGSQITLASGALLTVTAAGAVDYDPNNAFESLASSQSATDSFSYTITDSNGGSDMATVTVTVDGVNDDPTMNDGAMNADEDGSPVNLNLGTLGNDVDNGQSGPTLSYAITTQPGEGTASITGTTNLNFDPGTGIQDLNQGETRDVTIGVTATDGDGGTSNEGTVTVTILGVNDDPTLGAGVLSADEDGAAVTLNLNTLGDDADNEDTADTLTYTVATQPGEGSAMITGTQLSFDPGSDFQDLAAGETRDVTIVVQAEDARGATVQNDVVVTVTGVNDDPDPLDDSYSVDEDGTLSVLAANGVLSNDNDIDGDMLSVGLITDVSNGSLSLNTDGSFDYTPDADFNGTDSFTYEADDGNGGTTQAVVSITVNAVNDLAVANDDSYSTAFGTALSVSAAGVLSNDTDVEGDALTAAVVTGPANGTLSLNGDGSLMYTPDGGFTGADTFTYVANDGTGDSAEATVTINVGANGAPTALNDSYSMDEDGTLNINAAGVLANDSDPDGDTLSAVLVTDVSNGTLMLNADGSFDYTPDADFNGSDSFTYEADDGNGGTTAATVSIAVNAVNDDPDAVDDSGFATGYETAVDIDATALTANDDDGDPEVVQPLSVTGVNAVAGGAVSLAAGVITFTPDTGFSGTASFTYDISDGAGGTDTATVSVEVAAQGNLPPVPGVINNIYSEDGAQVDVDLLMGATDPNSDALNISNPMVMASDGRDLSGIVSITGSTISITPTGNFEALNSGDSVIISVDYGITDGLETVAATALFTISGVNDAPVIGPVGAFDVDENSVAVGTIAATDVDDSGLTFSVSGGADQALFDIDATTGELAFTIAPDFETPSDVGGDNGYEVEVSVSDGDLAASTLVTVNVVDVNEGPNVIQGTGVAFEMLDGTDGQDEIRTGGGGFDYVTGGGDADVFVFEQMDGNGREMVNILDYEVGVDSIDLQGRDIMFDFSVGNVTYLMMQADLDTIVVNGAASIGDITFVSDDPFEML